MNKVLHLSFCLFCALVAFLVLGLNYFALYQLLPIVVFYLFQRSAFDQISTTGMKLCYTFAILLLLVFPLLAQLSWHFDLYGIQSKSSTSGLLFVFLPLYATLPGLLPCTIAIYLKSRSTKNN